MVSIQENKIRLAVPKKGRLCDRTISLLERAGLDFRRNNRSDVVNCRNLPISLIFLPAKDIPLYVGEGDVHLGITGEDTITECQVTVSEMSRLGFGRCRLCLLAPKDQVRNINELQDKKVVTSFPNITGKFFQDHKVEVKIKELSGSIEAACELGLAHAVVDLVESGETMKAANLEIVSEIMSSECVYIANEKYTVHDVAQSLKFRFDGIITAERYAMIEYNIPREKLCEGEKITPGRKSPTVMPTENPDWLAVKSTVMKSEINNIIESLRAVGATDIMVYNIENCCI